MTSSEQEHKYWLSRAAVIDGAGDAESFRLEAVTVTGASKTQVIIRQSFASINRGDVVRRSRGLFLAHQPSPYVLGFEGAGVVEAVGSEVTSVNVGDHVAYLAEHGGYSEYVVVDEGNIWSHSDSVSSRTAAAVLCTGLTSVGLASSSGINAGEVALVTGAAGGAASILCQVLEQRGVELVPVVRTRAGATHLSSLIRSTPVTIAAGESESLPPVDYVFDCVGAATLDVGIAALKPRGTWMYYGSSSGHPDFPGGSILTHQLRIEGFVVFEHFLRSGHWSDGVEQLTQAITNGLEFPIDHTVSLSQVGRAHREIEAGGLTGKVLIDFTA